MNPSLEVLVSSPLLILVAISKSYTCSSHQFWSIEIKLHTCSDSDWELFSNTCSHPALRAFKFFVCYYALFLTEQTPLYENRMHTDAFSKITLLMHINWFQTTWFLPSQLFSISLIPFEYNVIYYTSLLQCFKVTRNPNSLSRSWQSHPKWYHSIDH